MGFKKFLCLVLSLLMCATFASCGKEEEVVAPPPEPVVVEPKEPEIIKTEVVYTYSDSNYDSWLKFCETEYESRHEDIDIVLKFVDSETLSNRINKLAAGENINLGDIVEVSWPNIPTVFDNNLAVRLDNVNPEDYYENVYSAFCKDDSLYGIPLSYETVGLWYNKALFDEKGVAYPNSDWSWMTLVDAAGSLTDEANGKYGIVAAHDNLLPLYVTVNEMGGSIYPSSEGEGGFASELTKAGVRCFVDLLEAGYSPSMESIREEDAVSQLLTGKVAMIYAGNSCFSKVLSSEAMNDIGCTYVPALGGNRRVPLMVKGNCILANSEHQKEAWDFLSFITTDAGSIEKYIKCENLIPAYKQAEEKFVAKYADTSLHFEALTASVAENSFIISANDTDAIILEKLANVFELKNSVDEAASEICNN